MKYQIGDEIIVLHSHEEGRIIDIVNDDMVMIEVRGVKFPAYMDQIDFPYFYRFSKKTVVAETKKPAKVFIDNVPKEKPTPNQHRTEDGVWLCFIPKFSLDEFNDEVVDFLKIYLINKTNKAFSFTYTQQLFGEDDFALTNQILPYHDFYLHDLSFACLNDQLSFCIEFQLTTPEKNKADFYEVNYKPKPKQFFKKIELMKVNNEPTIMHQLFTHYPEKAIKEEGLDLSKLSNKGFKIYPATQIKQHMPAARSVVDLHIEKLIDNWQGKSNFEILTIQLQEFEKWYNIAVSNKATTFTVIHGVGAGVLRDEIHNILKTKKEVNYFVNQYTPNFGYGATEIFFK